MSNQRYFTAICRLVFPVGRLDRGALKEDQRLIALRRLGNIRKEDDVTELIEMLSEASDTHGEELDEEEAQSLLNVLQQVEALLVRTYTPEASPANNPEGFLQELREVTKDERSDRELDWDTIQEKISESDLEVLEADADGPSYLHEAIGALAWIKGSTYDYTYPESEEPMPESTEPLATTRSAEGTSVEPPPSPFGDGVADLLADLGLGDVVETANEAVAAGKDPLAHAKKELEAVTEKEDTPPEGRRERPERVTTAAAGKGNYTRVELSQPPPPDPDVLRIQGVLTAQAEEKAVLRGIDAEVSVVVRDALLLALGEAKTVADCMAFSNAWRHEGPCAALAFPRIPAEVKQHHGWTAVADLADRLRNPVAVGTPVLTPRDSSRVSSKLNELWSKFKAQEQAAAQAAKLAPTT